MKTQSGIGVLGVIAAVLAISLIVLGGNAYNKHQEKKSALAIKAVFDRWNDAKKLASSTPRIALATPVKEMQAVRNDAKALVVTDCLKRPKAHMESGMEKTIDAFMKFMRDSESDAVAAAFEESNNAFALYADSMKKCGFYF